MPKLSAGLLMFRKTAGLIEVLLVHPGGPYWKAKDLGAWSIPKGEFTDEEGALSAAQREFREETGIEPAASGFIPLDSIRLKGGKRVEAWAFEGDCDATQVRSNTFSIEWPPRSGKFQEFPEVDRAAWFSIAEAREKIHPEQMAFLDRLCSETL